MGRYFLEVGYKGTRYSGFQIQENAVTIQSEVEKAFHTLHRTPVSFTGSSRTDAGVHALQNFFHFDFEEAVHPQAVYKLNAILPPDIVVHRIMAVPPEAHARFDATSREYHYRIHQLKDPFLTQASLYYPYQLDLVQLEEGAKFLQTQQNFFAFCKTNTQVKNFQCTIYNSYWQQNGANLLYTIRGNRFLRGMVRLITATLLKLGRGKLSMGEFQDFFSGERKAGFSVPPYGLYLKEVHYPEDYFPMVSLCFTGKRGMGG